ncbi:MAG: exo-beta-N-acetylmuramidase NamZ domain-containing protein, partial [Bacteroidia bacterium]
MFKYKYLIFFIAIILLFLKANAGIITGAQQTQAYLPLIKGKNISLVVNQTSMIGEKHLVDSLLSLNIRIKKIFAPEHGFRGDHGAGEKIKSTIDTKTGLPIISLYGEHKKPTLADLNETDIVIFDIQDVGARFYTYISTLHYVMEACAELNKELIILDRPNPNGHYVDGPVLDMKFKSFVGMHPVPVVHGMTIGEYAKMINGEKWLLNGVQCKLKIIELKNYTHDSMYRLPVRPSPNLPTMGSIYLYPSLCFFEGTNYSVGRGTDKPFECLGKPGMTQGNYRFIPRSVAGVADHPPFEGKE